MDERCIGQNCSLVPRVKALEEQFQSFQSQKNTDHHEIFNRLGELEQLVAVQEERDKTINDKLDKLIGWQEQQKGRPAHFIDIGLGAAITAVVVFLLAQLGIM